MSSRCSLRSALLIAAALVALAAAALAQARRPPAGRPAAYRSTRAVGRAHAGRRQQAPEPPGALQFGDVVLSGFETLDATLGQQAKVTGPNTTVDAVDTKQNARSRLQANSLMAWTDPKKRNTVTRIEATDNVRFSSTRPTAGGSQTVRGTGRKAVYEKAKGILTVDGPVDFTALEPGADGKTTQSVKGRANRVVYDEGKRTLVFSGDVSGAVVVPDIAEGEQPFSGDEVTVDMSQQPYRIRIENPSLRGRVELHPKQNR